jgi:hypothetical protein
MRPIWFRASILLAACGALFAGGPPVSDPEIEAQARGVFVGRSGKPMAQARLILAEVVGDTKTAFARVRFPAKTAPAVADGYGRFRLRIPAPGNYTIVYQPAGTGGPWPAEIDIQPLAASAKSILPLMRNAEVGMSGVPYTERSWGQGWTLLKGHTFYSEGPYMRIWNATVRHGAHGLCLEIRKGVLWQERLDGKSRIRLMAWSY